MYTVRKRLGNLASDEKQVFKRFRDDGRRSANFVIGEGTVSQTASDELLIAVDRTNWEETGVFPQVIKPWILECL